MRTVQTLTPPLSSMVAPQVVTRQPVGATSDDKVGIMTPQHWDLEHIGWPKLLNSFPLIYISCRLLHIPSLVSVRLSMPPVGWHHSVVISWSKYTLGLPCVIIHRGHMWPVGISTILQRPLTIPLHSPNRRQMFAISAMQGDCERVYFCWFHWIGVVEWVENKLARAFSVLITWKLVTSSGQDEYCWCPSLSRGEAVAHTDAVYPTKYEHSFIGSCFVYVIIGVI